MSLIQILQIVSLLLVGCAMRFILPYILVGFEAVGRENTWKAWPPWEWRYLTSLVLSLIGYGVMMVVIPDTVAKWAAMAPVQVIIFAYAGQDVASRLQKPFRKR
jgi:hypothetical protein